MDCIYYDLENVSPNDVRRARARAPHAREFMARGTSWPIDVDGVATTRITGPRESSYQQELMDWMNKLFAAFERSTAVVALHDSHGASLLEIIRYRFLFDLAAIEQRLRALSEMARDGAKHVLWVAPSETFVEDWRICAPTFRLRVSNSSPRMRRLVVDILSTSSPERLSVESSSGSPILPVSSPAVGHPLRSERNCLCRVFSQ